ncbi:MAG: metalloregulator ArsR/SmtB family transcription factor [Deltaproteobacteria bacterium]|nr:metalloregulator ArsR/SmtB family transcription factor [Deltaproteobacteria bacterium]
MKTLFDIQAAICKALSNPKRLEIIYALKDGEHTVSEIVEAVGQRKANVSQNLAVLKNAGILKARRDGLNIHYSIANEKIVTACGLMREFLMEGLEESKTLLTSLRRVK